MKSRSVSSAVLKFSRLTALLSIGFCALPAVQAQETSKIGFIRSDRILTESNLAKAASAKIEQEFSKREKELQELANRLKVNSEKLDKDAAVLSESDRNKRQRELTELDKEFQRKQREFREDLNQRKNEELAAVQERATKIIRQVAEMEKYDIVFQEAVWFNPRLDITDKVIKALNAAK